MKKIVAIDVAVGDKIVPTMGIAYYRLTPEMKEFLEKCENKHGILGFEWEGGFNFGVILCNPT